jgi:hypothetical protein
LKHNTCTTNKTVSIEDNRELLSEDFKSKPPSSIIVKENNSQPKDKEHATGHNIQLYPMIDQIDKSPPVKKNDSFFNYNTHVPYTQFPSQEHLLNPPPRVVYVNPNKHDNSSSFNSSPFNSSNFFNGFSAWDIGIIFIVIILVFIYIELRLNSFKKMNKYSKN